MCFVDMLCHGQRSPVWFPAGFQCEQRRSWMWYVCDHCNSDVLPHHLVLAFLVAWGGMAGQAARLLGLMKLSLDLKKMGVRRWETYAFWGWLVFALGEQCESLLRVYFEPCQCSCHVCIECHWHRCHEVCSFAQLGKSTSSYFISHQRRRYSKYAQCRSVLSQTVRSTLDPIIWNIAHLVCCSVLGTAVVSSALDIILEVYCLIRILYLIVPAFLSSQHKVDALVDVRVSRALSLLILDLASAAPAARSFGVLADFLPFSIGALLVLGTACVPPLLGKDKLISFFSGF